MNTQRKNPFARKSSLLGRQERADARAIAHKKTMAQDKTLNIGGYRMPDPGPMVASKRKHVRPFQGTDTVSALNLAHNHLADVDSGKVPFGLRACAALDLINKEAKSGN